MDLRQLEYFISVAEDGSFSAAADRLGLGQPVVWRQVKALERELKVPLFERFGRRVRPTSAGDVLLPSAKRVLRSAEQFRHSAFEIAGGRSGVVRLRCASPHLLRFLVPLIRGFHDRRPDVHLELDTRPGLPDLQDVLQGDADLATGLPVTDGRLRGRILGDAEIVLVTAEGHPWRTRTTVDVSELRGVPVLTGPATGLGRQLLADPLRRLGLTLDIVHEAHDLQSLVALSRAGLGVGIVPDDHQHDEPSTGGWPKLTDDGVPVGTSVWIYWSATRELSPPVVEFIRHVASAGSGSTT